MKTDDPLERDSVVARVWRNRKHSHQVSLRENYTTDEIIEALKEKDLSYDQALELEDMLITNMLDKD